MDSIIKDDPIISGDNMKAIFSIIEIICKVNREFLVALEAKIKSYNLQETLIGDLLANFVSRIPFPLIFPRPIS